MPRPLPPIPPPPPDLRLTSPSEVRALLASWDFHPSRVLGQNFLIDRNILGILLDAAELAPSDTVVEPGPGLGVLTQELLRAGVALTAVEKDPRLAAFLRLRFPGHPRFTLLEGDVLRAPLPTLFASPAAKLVSNLPYAVAARLLLEILSLPALPARIVVTVQREVADRMAAAPGTPDYGLLSIRLQRHYAVRTLKTISPTCFWPAPEVRSAISLLVRRPAPLGGPAPEADLAALLRHAFSQRRKTLARSLRPFSPDPAAALAALSLPPETRPETVPPDLWPPLLAALQATRV